MKRHVVVVLLALVLAGCGSIDGSPNASQSTATPMASAPAGDVGLALTCGGGIVFTAAALEAAPGAETRPGPEGDALRDALARTGSEMEGYLPTAGWRQVARDATTVLFLAVATDGGDPPWRMVTLTFGDGRWQLGGAGACNLQVVPGPGIGSASWSLDPAFPPPGATDTEIHVQVWERACASGQPATGRVVGPVVRYQADTVTVTYGVRPKPGDQECPSNPPTPVLLVLEEPLGDRVLLDGGTYPAAPPAPPF